MNLLHYFHTSTYSNQKFKIIYDPFDKVWITTPSNSNMILFRSKSSLLATSELNKPNPFFGPVYITETGYTEWHPTPSYNNEILAELN